ncbi:F-box and leucine-rich repeat protein [Spatholobus suberectus]|nr:F-box and leucine-rich repeat protein [Spatholobus suberectus]
MSASFSFGRHSIHLKMDNSVFNGAQIHHDRTSSSYSSSSQRDVRYSCGTCGYELNLSSSNRNISSIGSKYGKSIKRGIISFFNVDDSRFTQADETECVPYFSKHSWGLFRRKTKLLCRKCCNHIGYAYNCHTSSSLPLVSNGTEPSPATEASTPTKYDIRIRALQPSTSSEEYGITVLA